MQNKSDGDDSDHHVEFTGGNVRLITTKESWEQKLDEAKRDGKIVSILVLLGFFVGWACTHLREICSMICYNSCMKNVVWSFAKLSSSSVIPTLKDGFWKCGTWFRKISLPEHLIVIIYTFCMYLSVHLTESFYCYELLKIVKTPVEELVAMCVGSSARSFVSLNSYPNGSLHKLAFCFLSPNFCPFCGCLRETNIIFLPL